jgi:hypothetical protein
MEGTGDHNVEQKSHIQEKFLFYWNVKVDGCYLTGTGSEVRREKKGPWGWIQKNSKWYG